MKKDLFLREVAESAYNIGYAAKKNFATYDIVEKAPGWISLITLGLGVMALVNPLFEGHTLAALVLIVGVASMYFNSYLDTRREYFDHGEKLTGFFTSLRSIYFEIQSRNDGDNSDDLKQRYEAILTSSQQIKAGKQIFLSDWYAHYKFFWQAQIGWVDEQLKFRFWRDKMPLSAAISVPLIVVTIVLLLVRAYFVCPVTTP